MGSFPFQGIILRSVLRDMSIVGRRQMLSRRFHGFIIKLRGVTEYCMGSACWLLEPGQILFVPKGSSYFIREVEPGYSYVVNFDCPSAPAMARLPLPKGMDITQSAEKLFNSWQRENPYATLCCLYQLLEKVCTEQPYSSPREKRLLEPVLQYLRQHLTDPELDVSELASLAGVSQVYLRRVFKKQLGFSPSSFVIRERLRRAEHLLLSDRSLSVTQVAAQVGYRDPLYFSRLFKKQLGSSPAQYRQAHQDELF